LPDNRRKGSDMKKVVVVMLGLLLAGCETWNQRTLAPSSIKAVTDTTAISFIDSEGNLTASSPGMGMMQASQDTEGNWFHTPVSGGLMSGQVPFGDTTIPFQVFSPGDTEIGEVQYTPVPGDGEPMLVLKDFKTNISVSIEKLTPALVSALQSLQGMAKEEALARVEQWRIAGQITADFANALVQLVPLLVAP